MINRMREMNPDYMIHNVTEESFRPYGRVLKADVQEGIDYTKAYQSNKGYEPDIKELMDIPCIQTLAKEVYGGLDTMAGIVQGDNHVVNGMEYHQCSETIIAVTDIILALGQRSDMCEYDYDINKCELFYVPQGTIIELYATTLHYTPICVNEHFKTICFLLKGTGDPIERMGILKKKNKWFIAHSSNIEKVQSGDYPGLKGDLITIHTV